MTAFFAFEASGATSLASSVVRIVFMDIAPKSAPMSNSFTACLSAASVGMTRPELTGELPAGSFLTAEILNLTAPRETKSCICTTRPGPTLTTWASFTPIAQGPALPGFSV
jgi:hypothetical protein